jgi:tetratricopeptide (TPR) repeat protein
MSKKKRRRPAGLHARPRSPGPSNELDAQRAGEGLALLAEGARLLGRRELKEAERVLQEAAQLLPGDAAVAINLGGVYILQRRYDKAVALLQEAGVRHPDNAMLWVNLAAAYLGTLEFAGPQQQARAIAAFERALEIDAGAPHVHYNLALIYNDQGNLERARQHFQLALATDPNDADARLWLRRLDEMQAGGQSDAPQ